MAISKSKNKRNLAKRKLRKENQLKVDQLHNAVVIAAMTNTYENRLNELLKQNTNDISRIDQRINKQNIGTFVYLEPISKTIAVEDATQTANIVIGFLTQDEPDSSSDAEVSEASTLSMEEKVADMETAASLWLTYFFDNYKFRINGAYTLAPVFRIKNVMTGVLLTFSLIEPKQC